MKLYYDISYYNHTRTNEYDGTNLYDLLVDHIVNTIAILETDERKLYVS